MNRTAPLNPITLRFRDEALEAIFAKDYVRTSLAQARAAIFMGFMLYVLFGFLDPWMVPGALSEVLLVRSVICALLLGLFLASLTPLFRRQMQAVLTLVSLVGALGVVMLVVVAQDTDRYYDYYVGLVLILFFVHVLLRLRFVYAAVVGWGMLGVYNAAALGLTATPVPVIINSNFFLIGANVSGMVASYLLERYAREVFWQTRLLEEKHRQLATEDRRKTRELNEARKLQQAMLPEAVPAHPLVDIAAYARPATEVGGDYYDFALSRDGTLTFAIGDATGHGAQASAMVTATKVLFAGLAQEVDLRTALQTASRILKRAGLGRRYYMALALGRLTGTTLELAGAGLPPALLRRAASGDVEEIALKGPPLGSFPDFPYQQTRLELTPGDTLLLMSDGLPELFNAAGDPFGYDRIAPLMHETAGDLLPEQLVARFAEAGAAWRAGHPQSDDLTLLALRTKTPVPAAVVRGDDGLAPRPEAETADRPSRPLDFFTRSFDKRKEDYLLECFVSGAR